MSIVDSLVVETLSLPTPYAVGPVNAYLIPQEPLTMIDAGVNTVEAESALKLGFSTRGLSIDSVDRILVTHGHPDHYGLAPFLQQESGAKTFMGADELQRITDDRTFWQLGRLLMEAGFPEDLLKSLSEEERRLNRVHRVTQLNCSPVEEGDIFEFRDFKLEAICLPGHTKGHMGYLEPASGTLFAGDTLVAHGSPNPLLEPILEPEGESPAQRRRSLKQYLESLDRLEALDLSTVYPGHGPVITNPAETIAYMREHHARRLEVVGSCLCKRGNSAFEVTSKLYPGLVGYEQLLAVSEVIAHLDVLVENKFAAQEIRDDGVEYFFI